MQTTTEPQFVVCEIHFQQKCARWMELEESARKALLLRLENAKILCLPDADTPVTPGVATREATWDRKRIEKYFAAGWTIERVLVDQQKIEDANLALADVGRVTRKQPAPVPKRHARHIVEGVYRACYDFSPHHERRARSAEVLVPFLKGDQNMVALMMARAVRGKTVPLVLHSPAELARARTTLANYGTLTRAVLE